MNDARELVRWLRDENGFLDVRELPDGSVAAVGDLYSTRAIYLGMTRNGWERRFCFADRMLALVEYSKLQSEDDEPTGWIARRPELPCDIEAKSRPPAGKEK